MKKPHAIHPVILSGGSGTRMWPISHRARPKQFHRLTSGISLFQETILRVTCEDQCFEPPIILGAAAHKTLMLEDMDAIGVRPALTILEPAPKNTAPAIAAAALAAESVSPGAVLVILPADHAIRDEAGFRSALLRGAQHAVEGRIVTFGITPTGPETGYGYIRGSEKLSEDASVVLSFEEKPDLETAEKYVASGDYFWNAGIFMFRSDVMIEEMRKYCPATLNAVERALDTGERDDRSILLDATAFANSIEDSIDYAVMEHTDLAAVVAMDVGWSDIGSWATLWEISKKCENGNANSGNNAIILDSNNTLTVSNGPKIAAIGVSDLLIVATPKGVLVARRDKAQDVKKIVNQLKAGDLSGLY